MVLSLCKGLPILFWAVQNRELSLKKDSFQITAVVLGNKEDRPRSYWWIYGFRRRLGFRDLPHHLTSTCVIGGYYISIGIASMHPPIEAIIQFNYSILVNLECNGIDD